MANDPQFDLSSVAQDKDFLAAPLDQKIAYLAAHDKDFAAAPPEDQKAYISHLTNFNVQSMQATPFARAVTVLPEGQLRLRNEEGLPASASQAQVANEYNRESGALATSAAATMATGGLNQGPGVLRLLARSGTTGAASGGGALVGGATPQEATGYAIGGAIAQPVSEGLSAGVRFAASKAPSSSVWENIWNRLTGKAQYAEALETAKNANLARYRLTEQNAASAIDEATANVAKARAQLPAGEAGQWADLSTAVGATPRSIRIGKGVSDLSMSYGNAGRGLLREGFDAETLSKLTPPQQAAMIGPKWQAAGKAVQDAADKATSDGITLNAGKSAWGVINRISDPAAREQALNAFKQLAEDTGIQQKTGEKFLEYPANPTETLSLRQALGDKARFGPSGDYGSLSSIRGALYRAVSGDLHDAVPSMKPVDFHYGDLLEAVNSIQKQTQRYAAGQWKSPQTAVEKAQAKVPELPNVSPYTPLPAPPSALSQFLTAGKNLAPWMLGGGTLGGGLYGLERLRRAVP